jgi:amino acid transporter
VLKKKNFRLADCVLAVVCVVLAVDAAAPAASIGNSQVFWWLVLLVCFCLPYALISAELGVTYEGEGGLYDWVSRAFGPKWGSRVAGYYWVNLPLWMASGSVMLTDNIQMIAGRDIPLPVVILIQLVFVWSVTVSSLLNLSESKWLLNIGTMLKAVIVAGLGVIGIYTAVTRGLVNPLSLRSMLPGADLRSLSYVSIIIFNFMGFEVVTTYVGSMPKPKRDIPKAIIYGGLAVTALYMLAAFSISAAIPTEEISESMGILDAVGLMTGGPGSTLIALLGIMILFAMFSNQLSWVAGTNFVARYCAKDGGLPKIFGISTKKRDAPLGAALMDGGLATVLILLAPLLPSERLFWSFFALNLVMFLLSYVPLFPAFLKLRKMDPEIDRAYRVPGGKKLLTAAAYLPLILLCVSLVFTVIPLNRGELADKIPLVIGSAAGIVAGEVIITRVNRNRRNRVNKEAQRCQGS